VRAADVKPGALVTEAAAARWLGISRERLRVDILTGWLFSAWVGGHRLVMLPNRQLTRSS
jgi:hypothetical protein